MKARPITLHVSPSTSPPLPPSTPPSACVGIKVMGAAAAAAALMQRLVTLLRSEAHFQAEDEFT